MLSEISMDNSDQKPFMETGKLSLGLEHFSNLSSEMSALLSNLLDEISKSGRELQEVRQAVEVKKNELEGLRRLERSAEMLQQQISTLQQQKEDLERAVDEQRRIWEDERALHAKKEKEHAENLKTKRQKEEEEYTRVWSEEKARAGKALEEELAGIRQKNLREQEALERELHLRESDLARREFECARLIKEMEQLLDEMARRNRNRSVAGPAQQGESPNEDAVASEFNLAQRLNAATDSSPHGEDIPRNPSPGDGTVWDNV
jgi:DNA repair exonuclease SbcCD ATPase subunit